MSWCQHVSECDRLSSELISPHPAAAAAAAAAADGDDGDDDDVQF